MAVHVDKERSGVFMGALIDMNKTYVVNQAFIQAHLSTAVFPQRFSFFTVCLVTYIREVPPWWVSK